MTSARPQNISALITAWGNGDEQALSSLMAFVYPELRRIARQHLGRRPAGESLESAALANEAYLKFVRAGGIHCEKPCALPRFVLTNDPAHPCGPCTYAPV